MAADLWKPGEALRYRNGLSEASMEMAFKGDVPHSPADGTPVIFEEDFLVRTSTHRDSSIQGCTMLE